VETVLEVALRYCELGLSVIPVGQDKKPLIKWEQYQKRKATAEEIREWAKKYPAMNIAIVSGEISNLTVIDCDSKEAIGVMESMLPEICDTPMQDTPRGGRHYLFQYAAGIRNKAAVLEHIDVRSEGGYFLVSPSRNGEGRAYRWVEGFDLEALSPAPLPSMVCEAINSNTSFNKSFYAPVDVYKNENAAPPASGMFTEGRRDQDLFHIANILAKGRATRDEMEKVLGVLGRACIPPFPEREIITKIQSAIERSGRREGSLKAEVEEYVLSTNGNFLSTEIYKELSLSTRDHKKNVSIILKRMVDEGVIEKYGAKNGSWRRIDRNFQEQCWWEDDGSPLPLQYPLGVEEFAKIYSGNVILLEGQKSQGKSAFALEFCRLNRRVFPGRKILYQNVEMADSEIKERAKAYPRDVMTQDDWRESVTFIRQTGEWWDKIEADAINVVDYLIEYKEAYLIADFIFKIHQKLKSGIALVIVQRDPLRPYPAGGRAVRDIPRLVLSLIHHRLKLEDVKSFWPRLGDNRNPTGLTRRYKQASWWKFVPGSEWDYDDDDPKLDKYKREKR
jgi:hypothetical protein